MTPGEQIIQDVCNEVWGFVPNRQVKPVHFANRFFRSICGQGKAPDLLQEAAGGFRKGKSRITDQQLIHNMNGRYVSGDEARNVDHVKVLRSALDLVLNQDRAAFGGGQFFSLTLTHRNHTTGDPSDRQTGKFMAEVLAAMESNGLLDRLRRSLDDSADDIYILTAPLLENVEMGPAPEPRPEIVEVVRQSPALRSVRDAFATMVLYDRLLEKTTFLQRIITLGSFGLFLHLINRSVESVERDQENMCAPLLLCAPKPSSETVEASRATVNGARRRIERAFEQGLMGQLRARGEDAFSEDGYRALGKEWLPKGSGAAGPQARFSRDFEAFSLAGVEPNDAFCRAVTRASFASMVQGQGVSPDGFAVSIGRMAGLIYPRQQGRGDKYCLPSPQFLDMLVTALLEPGEEVTVEKFWKRAWSRFGLLCGACTSHDADILYTHGIRQVAPKRLSHNARALLQELVRMGHAQEYADDVAVVRAVGGTD